LAPTFATAGFRFPPARGSSFDTYSSYELGLSQIALATATDVSKQTIISTEQGNYAPSVCLALRVATALESTVEDLWG